MKFDCCTTYSQLKKKKIIDRDGVQIGKGLIDVAFKPSLPFELSHFVVGGGFLEEFLENLRFKKDLDPVFSVDCIEEVGKEIKLSCVKTELKNRIEKAIPEEHYALSALKKIPVIDKKGIKIGTVADFAFYEDNSMSFIIGGSKIEEFLEGIKIIPDVDLIVPVKEIEKIEKNKICLALTKSEIKTTLQKTLTSRTGKDTYLIQDTRNRVGVVGAHPSHS